MGRHGDIITEIVDKDTGELLVTRKTKHFRSIPEPSFIKMYIEDVSKLNSLSNTAKNLLFSMVNRVGYDSVITLHLQAKREMCSEMGIKSTQTIENTLKHLVDAGMIKRVCRGSYMLNPEYFAKGQWSDIKKIREAYQVVLTVTYDKHGKKIESNIMSKEEYFGNNKFAEAG